MSETTSDHNHVCDVSLVGLTSKLGSSRTVIARTLRLFKLSRPTRQRISTKFPLPAASAFAASRCAADIQLAVLIPSTRLPDDCVSLLLAIAGARDRSLDRACSSGRSSDREWVRVALDGTALAGALIALLLCSSILLAISSFSNVFLRSNLASIQSLSSCSRAVPTTTASVETNDRLPRS